MTSKKEKKSNQPTNKKKKCNNSQSLGVNKNKFIFPFVTKKFIIIIGLLSIIEILIISLVIIASLFKTTNESNEIPKTFFVNEHYNQLYDKVESTAIEFEKKYKVKIDKYLIIAALTAYQDNYIYYDSEIENINKIKVSKTINQMLKKVELLAKYQIKTITNCDYENKTMRKISSNDDSTSLFATKNSKEKNYECKFTDKTYYELSNIEGNIDDSNSGSTFYWNMIDEDFLKEYYYEFFSKIKGDKDYEYYASKMVKYIYLYASALRNLDEYSQDSNLKYEEINIECPTVNVVEDEDSINAKLYQLDEYVAGVIATYPLPLNILQDLTGNEEIKEYLKSLAIIVRTNFVNLSNNGSVSLKNQAFIPTDNALIWEAVNATTGLVLVQGKNIELPSYKLDLDSENCTSTSCSYNITSEKTSTKSVKIPINWLTYALEEQKEKAIYQLINLNLAAQGKNFEKISTYIYKNIQIKKLKGTSNSIGAYKLRTSNAKNGICDGTSYYGFENIGSDYLTYNNEKIGMSLLSCTAQQAQKAFVGIAQSCGKIPHAGSLRYFSDEVNSSRISTSIHYTGRAFDFDPEQGMKLENTYFYVTYDNTSSMYNSDYYRLYCKVTGDDSSQYVSFKTIVPLEWSNDNIISKEPITDKFLDVTAVLNRYGLYGIGPRECINEGNYLCTEWWHFQDTSGFVEGQTTFKQSLNQYYGKKYDYSKTPLKSYLNNKWNGMIFN